MVQDTIDYDSLKDFDTSKSKSRRAKKISKKSTRNFSDRLRNNPLRNILSDKSLIKKIGFTLFIILIYRFMSAVPLPGMDISVYRSIVDGASNASEASYLFLIFTGSQLESPSIVGLGIIAYINASIIMQLMTPVVPKLTELQKEGAQGQQVINKYTRYLSLPLAFLYSVVYLVVISQTDFSQNGASGEFLIPHAPDSDFPSAQRILFMSLILTAGTMLLMWLAEAITENGLGNGTSIIISIGILASLPALVSQDFSALDFNGIISELFSGNFGALSDPLFVSLIGIIVGAVGAIAIIVFVNESIRKVKISYARRAVVTDAAEDSHLPIKLLLSGVLPIIFASALLSVPQLVVPLLNRFLGEDNEFVANLSEDLGDSFLFAQTDTVVNGADFIYSIVFFILIVGFGMFYAFIILKPKDTAENLQKSTAFIPGIRPGEPTEKFISRTLLRISFIGSMALGLIALIPLVARNIVVEQTGVNLAILSGIGGTSILIVVSVVLDTMRQYNALRASKDYDEYSSVN